MILHFLRLEWKQFFRSAYWQKGIALKIVMGFFALYFIATFLAMGIFAYKAMKKLFPESDPLQLVNSFLVFVIVVDLIFRYMMQKLPVMNIKPMLILPIKKSKLVHYVLGKSSLSFFNFMSLFFYIPFSVVLIREGYNVNGVLAWLFSMIVITHAVNFLNFLINKNNKAFWTLATLLVAGFALKYFEIFNINAVSQSVFDSIVTSPILALIPLGILIILYIVNYRQLSNQVYLDAAVSVKVKEANTYDLSWANKFGDMAPFIKNEIRLIWRNKRTKTVFLMSFFFLFYGLIFFKNTGVINSMPIMLIFAALFVTGGFVINYGQFIPAWESSYYRMLMTQNISYRKYLDSKWFLMTVMTAALFILSTPYLLMGLDIYLMIAAGAAYNIGFNTLFLLYAGSFNRKKIDLNRSGFGNTQGTSATQFLIMIPVLGLPMLLFWGFSSLINFNAGIIAIASVGVLTIVFKNQIMNIIEKKYIKDKYAAIHAFAQND